jgi:hypothetical protein
MALAEMRGRQPSAVPGIVTVEARERTPTAVAEELLAALADEPRVVECDLTDMAGEGTVMGEALGPVGEYLRQWPGTVVLVNAPEPVARSALAATASAQHLRIHGGWNDARLRTHCLLPHVQRKALSMRASPTAPQSGRDFAAATLHDWDLPTLVTPVCQVLAELVTPLVITSDAELGVRLSRLDERVRIAVSIAAAGGSRALTNLRTHPLPRGGQRLVDELATGWGVLPGTTSSITLWAVLAHPPPKAGIDDRTALAGVAHTPQHRGPADPDALAEMHTRHRGRHRRED